MAATKNYFDQILENQNKLYTTLNDYLNQVVEISTPEKEVAEQASELLNEYKTRSYQLAEEMTAKENMEKFQQDFWGSFTGNFSKSMELSTDLYRKTTEYWQNVWGMGAFGDQQARVKKFSDIFQNCAKAYIETANANAKVVQDYLA